jgi:hypothetical protein
MRPWKVVRQDMTPLNDARERVIGHAIVRNLARSLELAGSARRLLPAYLHCHRSVASCKSLISAS